MSEISLNLTLLSIRADNKFILICQHLWYVKRLEGISWEDKSTEKKIKRCPELFIDYTMQHLVSNQKLTYHYIGFLQM